MEDLKQVLYCLQPVGGIPAPSHSGMVDLGGGKVLVWFLHGFWGLLTLGHSFPSAPVSGIGTDFHAPCVTTVGLLELYRSSRHSKPMALGLFVSYVFESGANLETHPEYAEDKGCCPRT